MRALSLLLTSSIGLTDAELRPKIEQCRVRRVIVLLLSLDNVRSDPRVRQCRALLGISKLCGRRNRHLHQKRLIGPFSSKIVSKADTKQQGGVAIFLLPGPLWEAIICVGGDP